MAPVHPSVSSRKAKPIAIIFLGEKYDEIDWEEKDEDQPALTDQVRLELRRLSPDDRGWAALQTRRVAQPDPQFPPRAYELNG